MAEPFRKTAIPINQDIKVEWLDRNHSWVKGLRKTLTGWGKWFSGLLRQKMDNSGLIKWLRPPLHWCSMVVVVWMGRDTDQDWGKNERRPKMKRSSKKTWPQSGVKVHLTVWPQTEAYSKGKPPELLCDKPLNALEWSSQSPDCNLSGDGSSQMPTIWSGWGWEDRSGQTGETQMQIR